MNIDPSKTDSYPIFLGDSLNDSFSRKHGYTSVKYNFKPRLSNNATRRTRITTSTSSDDLLTLTLQDEASQPSYTYAGRANPAYSHVLVYDSNRKAFVLEAQTDTIFNLTRTPSESDIAAVQAAHPPCEPNGSDHSSGPSSALSSDLEPSDDEHPYDYRKWLPHGQHDRPNSTPIPSATTYDSDTLSRPAAGTHSPRPPALSDDELIIEVPEPRPPHRSRVPPKGTSKPATAALSRAPVRRSKPANALGLVAAGTASADDEDNGLDDYLTIEEEDEPAVRRRGRVLGGFQGRIGVPHSPALVPAANTAPRPVVRKPSSEPVSEEDESPPPPTSRAVELDDDEEAREIIRALTPGMGGPEGPVAGDDDDGGLEIAELELEMRKAEQAEEEQRRRNHIVDEEVSEEE